jgi:hypothetical protein
MRRKIISVEYEIPGFSEDHCIYASDQSLLDADLIVFQPREFGSYGDGKVSFTEAGSFAIQESTKHWKRELLTALEYGKTVFLFLGRYEVASFQTGESEIKGRATINYVADHSNYEFLPVNLPPMTAKSGTGIVFTGDPVFAAFSNEFGEFLKYDCYLTEKVQRPIFVTRTGERPLGAVIPFKKGHLVLLPLISYDRNSFITKRKDREFYWTKKAVAFGHKLVGMLLDIDKSLRSESKETPPPTWAKNTEFVSAQEARILRAISDAAEEMKRLEENKHSLEADLKKEQELKNLLFGTGKPLEAAVTSALQALGYSAENYKDGELEVDQVIVSPEGERLVGECEGKDSSAVNIDKFRQLAENIQADLQREEIKTPAIGILFGNGFRLTAPKDRGEQFTEKCLSSAKRGTILVRTVDLYSAVRHIRETNDKSYMKACREAISAGVGQIVSFPVPPRQ